MYVRIARFEGGSSARFDAERDRLLKDLEAIRRGEADTEIPAEIARKISRVEMMVDRERGTSAMSIYCETAAQMREVDEALDAMSPGDGEGKRVSVEIYELALDEATNLSRAA
jgi:hypothetical protein